LLCSRPNFIGTLLATSISAVAHIILTRIVFGAVVSGKGTELAVGALVLLFCPQFIGALLTAGSRPNTTQPLIISEGTIILMIAHSLLASENLFLASTAVALRTLSAEPLNNSLP
jgi:hypothetical protein